MKKRLILLCAMLIALTPLFAHAAESDIIQIQDEWIGLASFTGDALRDIIVDGSGNFYANWYVDSDIMFYADGRIEEFDKGSSSESPTKELIRSITCDRFYSSENIRFYSTTESGSWGYIFLLIDGEWVAYGSSSTNTALFFENKVYLSKQSEPLGYLLSGTTMFLIQDENYEKGYIVKYSDDCFVYTIEMEDYVGNYRNSGKLLYAFVRSSVFH